MSENSKYDVEETLARVGENPTLDLVRELVDLPRVEIVEEIDDKYIAECNGVCLEVAKDSRTSKILGKCPQDFIECGIFFELMKEIYGARMSSNYFIDAHQMALHDEVLYVLKHLPAGMQNAYFVFTRRSRKGARGKKGENKAFDAEFIEVEKGSDLTKLLKKIRTSRLVDLPRVKIVEETDDKYLIECNGRRQYVAKDDVTAREFFNQFGEVPDIQNGMQMQLRLSLNLLLPVLEVKHDEDVPQEFIDVLIFYELIKDAYERKLDASGFSVGVDQMALHAEVLYVLKHLPAEKQNAYFEFVKRYRKTGEELQKDKDK